MSRRNAFKTGAGALAALGVALLPATLNSQGTDDKLRALLADLEAYEGSTVCVVVVERLMVAGRLREAMGVDFDFLAIPGGQPIPVSKDLSEMDLIMIASMEQEKMEREKSIRRNFPELYAGGAS